MDNIEGMPVKALKKMLANPRTPKHLKEAWRKKLELKRIAL